jgi:tetratricopeptide (TPR) repeat protein
VGWIGFILSKGIVAMRACWIAVGVLAGTLLGALSTAHAEQPADRLCAEGVKFLEEAEYGRAVATFDAAVQRCPNDVRAWVGRARALAGKEDLRAAIADCSRAVELDARCVEAFSVRGQAFLLKGDDERGFADLDAAVRLTPGIETGYRARGLSFLIRGKYERAIADFDRAICNDRLSAALHCNRGAAEFLARREKQALADWNDAIRIDPKCAEAYVNRAATEYALNDFVKALSDIDCAIRLEPRCAAIYTARAVLRMARPNASIGAEALSDCDAAVALDPADLNACMIRGLALYWRGHFEDAAEAFDDAIIQSPRCAGAHFARGFVRHSTDQQERSISDFTKAIELDPGDPQAWFFRALARLECGELAASASDFETAIRLDVDCDFRPRIAGAILDPGLRDELIHGRYKGRELPPRFAARVCYFYAAAEWDASRADADLCAAISLDPALAKARIRLIWLRAAGDYSPPAAGVVTAALLPGTAAFAATCESARRDKDLRALDEANRIVASAPDERAAYALRAEVQDRLARGEDARRDREAVRRLLVAEGARRSATPFELDPRLVVSVGDNDRLLAFALVPCRWGPWRWDHCGDQNHGQCRMAAPVGRLVAVPAAPPVVAHGRQPNPPTSTSSSVIPKPGGSVSAAFPLDNCANGILIPVSVGGKKFRFLLDTGCSESILDEDLIPLLGKRAPMRPESGRGYGGQYSLYEACSPLRMGAAPLRRVDYVCVADLAGERWGLRRDIYGVLGTDHLNGMILEIDFDESRLSLLARLPGRVDDLGVAVPIVRGDRVSKDFSRDSLWVRGTAGQQAGVTFMLDTGFRGSGWLSDTIAGRLVLAGDLRKAGRAMRASLSGDFPCTTARLEKLAVGPFEHRGLPFFFGECAQFGFDGQNILGLDYLRRYRVTLDLAHDVMYLKKGRHFSDPDRADAGNEAIARTEASIPPLPASKPPAMETRQATEKKSAKP